MNAIRVNKYLMPVLAVVTLLGSVWIAKALGAWQTSGRDQILLDASGQPDPAGIKGWMTLADISETYGVPLDALYTLIGAGPDVPADTALKDLEKLVPGMEVSAVREGVAAYLEGTWVAPASQPTPAPTPLPASTAEHVPQGPGAGSGQGTGEGFSLPQDGSRLAAAEIRGRMTLQEVIDYCQVPADYLFAELGLPGDTDRTLRMSDLAQQRGIEVTTVRAVVERYQAEH